MPSAKAIRDVLAVHRDQPSIALDFSFPINWQMDEVVGETLANDLKTFGGEWEAMRATKSLGDHLPAKTGLYMFVFRSPVELLKSSVAHRPLWVFYVGRAGGRASTHTLKSRYRGEYSKYVCGDPAQLWTAENARTRAMMLQKYLAIWPLEYWFMVVEDASRIEALEDRLIKMFSPPLNKLGKLRIKVGEPKPAFRTI